MVFVLVGALILAGLFFLGFFVEVWCGCWYGCVHYLVVCCYKLYVHYVLALLFISLCRDAFENLINSVCSFSKLLILSE